MGQAQPAAALGDMAQGIGSRVAIGGGVGQAADAHGIQDDQEDPVDVRFCHALRPIAQGERIVKGDLGSDRAPVYLISSFCP
jgi:hypothetical protein